MHSTGMHSCLFFQSLFHWESGNIREQWVNIKLMSKQTSNLFTKQTGRKNTHKDQKWRYFKKRQCLLKKSQWKKTKLKGWRVSYLAEFEFEYTTWAWVQGHRWRAISGGGHCRNSSQQWLFDFTHLHTNNRAFPKVDHSGIDARIVLIWFVMFLASF